MALLRCGAGAVLNLFKGKYISFTNGTTPVITNMSNSLSCVQTSGGYGVMIADVSNYTSVRTQNTVNPINNGAIFGIKHDGSVAYIGNTNSSSNPNLTHNITDYDFIIGVFMNADYATTCNWTLS